VESTYLNRDMCKFESSQKDESRWQSTDSSKAYRHILVLLSVLYIHLNSPHVCASAPIWSGLWIPFVQSEVCTAYNAVFVFLFPRYRPSAAQAKPRVNS